MGTINVVAVTDLGTALDYQAACVLLLLGMFLVVIPGTFLYLMISSGLRDRKYAYFRDHYENHFWAIIKIGGLILLIFLGIFFLRVSWFTFTSLNI